jgi:hypothetical protein
MLTWSVCAPMQARNGLLRMLSPFKSFLPTSLRIIKCKNGALLDRYAAPTKKEILALLTPLASEEHPITSFESLMRKLKDKQTTPERLESIFDRFDAWEDPDPGEGLDYFHGRVLSLGHCVSGSFSVLPART